MILYTIMSEEFIYNNDYKQNESTKIVGFNNKKLEVVELEGGLCKVVRIMSTIPSDYIDPQIQPGEIIKLN